MFCKQIETSLEDLNGQKRFSEKQIQYYRLWKGCESSVVNPGVPLIFERLGVELIMESFSAFQNMYYVAT